MYDALDRVLDEKFGREAPSLLAIKKALTDCAELIGRILKQKGALEPDPTPPAPEAPDRAAEKDTVMAQSERSPGSATPLSDSVPLEPRDRAEALRRLAAVVRFFRKTEPHSPVAYLIERAIRWGEMPFEQWLQEVINNDDVLDRVRETLGLRNADASSDN
jgi:type VI secretion system protein ImpA